MLLLKTDNKTIYSDSYYMTMTYTMLLESINGFIEQ